MDKDYDCIAEMTAHEYIFEREMEKKDAEIKRLREALGDVVSDWPDISKATIDFCKQALGGE